MKDKDFIQVSEFVKEQEIHLVKIATLEHMVESESFEEALALLRQKRSDLFEESHTLEELDTVLGEVTESLYHTMYEHVPTPLVVDILAVRYEFDALKTALLTHFAFSTLPPVYLKVGTIPKEEYSSFFEHQDPFESKLPDYLMHPAQEAIRIINEGGSPAEAQQQFPIRMFAHMLEIAEEIENPYIMDMIQTMIDFHNSSVLLQLIAEQLDPASLESQLVSGGKTNTSFFLTGYTRGLATAIPVLYHRTHGEEIARAVAYFEKTGEFVVFRHLFRHIQHSIVKKAALIDYGAEIPFAYLLHGEYEIAQLRTLLYNKKQGVESKVIKEYLYLS